MSEKTNYSAALAEAKKKYRKNFSKEEFDNWWRNTFGSPPRPPNAVAASPRLRSAPAALPLRGPKKTKKRRRAGSAQVRRPRSAPLLTRKKRSSNRKKRTRSNRSSMKKKSPKAKSKTKTKSRSRTKTRTPSLPSWAK